MKKKVEKKKSVKNAVAVREKTEIKEIDVNPQSLIMAAIDRGVPIDVMEKLLAMRDRLNAERAESEFREAMSKFQSECPIIIKSTSVDYTTRSNSRVQYRYASLDVIISMVKEPLKNNGFSYRFTTEQTESSVMAICHSHHVGGHSESSSFIVPIDSESKMNAPQKVASALTYAKRYAFCDEFGILTGDQDDDAVPKHINIIPEKQPEIEPMTIEDACAKLRSVDSMRGLVSMAQIIKNSAKWNAEDQGTLNTVYKEMELKFKTK
jgi:hypothetical protein